MRLIHGNHCYAHLGQVDAEHLRFEALGRHVEETYVVGVHAVVDNQLNVVVRHARVDGGRFYMASFQVFHLVFHQCDERRDDEAQALQSQSGNLEADGLAAARGQQCQRVAAFQHRQDNILLQGPETIVAPVLLQDVVNLLSPVRCHVAVKKSCLQR